MAAPERRRETTLGARANSYLVYKQQQQHQVYLLLLLLLLQIVPAISFFFETHNQEWTYANQAKWRLENRQCGEKAQSPIDIQRRFVIHSSQLKLHFYNYNQLTRFRIQNAHHTIKISLIENQHMRNQFNLKLNPQIEDGGLNNSSFNLDPMNMSTDEDIEHDFEISGHSKATAATTTIDNNSDESKRSKVIVHKQQENPLTGGVNLGEPVDNNLNLADADSPKQQVSNTDELPYKGEPTIKLDWLDDGNNEYKLRDIHFHWGERRDNGSEHAIDGRRAAMEMHLVHIKNGLDKSKIGITSDSVTVIAILIESYRKSNADFNPIVNALSSINSTSQAQDIEYKSINDLLPNTLTSFYTYSGSLTTPPCHQVVNWIVMSDRLYLNAKQIEMFRNMYSPVNGIVGVGVGGQNSNEHHSNQIMPNIRQLQPLNNRTILASFSPLSRLEQMQVENSYSGAISIQIGSTNQLVIILFTSLIASYQLRLV